MALVVRTVVVIMTMLGLMLMMVVGEHQVAGPALDREADPGTVRQRQAR